MRARRTVYLVLSGCLLAAAAWAAGGSGTPDDPYVIETVEELQAMQDDLAAHYVLGNDIDASATSGWNGGAGFVPVGSLADPFTGELDGRGHVVRGLFIDRVADTYVALLGYAEGATIRRVHVEDAQVRGNSNVGILVGKARYETVVSLSSAAGTVTLRAGGGDAKSGGLVGHVTAGSRVEECFSDVEVFASSRLQVGSLVGYLRGVETTWPTATISNSYAAGTVHGNGPKQGNLLGDADGSRVDRCYSSGLGKALIGFNFRNPTITNSYWDADRGASSSPYGGSARTTEQMMRQATFVGWEFDEIWDIREDESYPFLRLGRPLAMARFRVAWARLAFRGPGADALRFLALFSLHETSDGIEPEIETVTVEVGGYAETLPPGSFACRSGLCTYSGDAGGIVRMVIGEVAGRQRDLGDYFARVEANAVDLSGTANPARFSVRIGDDEGQGSVRLGGTLAAPSRGVG